MRALRPPARGLDHPDRAASPAARVLGIAAARSSDRDGAGAAGRVQGLRRTRLSAALPVLLVVLLVVLLLLLLLVVLLLLLLLLLPSLVYQ